MAKTPLTADEATIRRRNYTRENRELWKRLGFRMCSAPVHDDDREEVLAELEVRRAQRLAEFADAKDTNIAVLVQIGRRNLNPPMTPKEMTDFWNAHKHLTTSGEIEHCIEQAKKAHTTFRNAGTNVNKTEDDIVKQRLFAKEVAYGNLSSAWMKLAVARANAGEVDRVFGEARHHV